MVFASSAGKVGAECQIFGLEDVLHVVFTTLEGHLEAHGGANVDVQAGGCTCCMLGWLFFGLVEIGIFDYYVP